MCTKCQQNIKRSIFIVDIADITKVMSLQYYCMYSFSELKRYVMSVCIYIKDDVG